MIKQKTTKRIISFIQQNYYLNDLKITLYNSLSFHKKGNNKDIFLFSNARGGSTLLEGIIATQPNISRIFEPLNWKRFYTRRTKIEPNYEYIYSSPERYDEIIKYFENIFENKMTVHFPLSFWRDDFKLNPDRYVFKLINCKELINLFEDSFDIKVIYFLRHPVPTILSRINWGWKNFNNRFYYLLNDYYFKKLFPETLLSFSKEALRSDNLIEQYTTGWCIENYLPLNVLDKKKWLMMTYEDLIVDTHSTLIKLSDFLEVDRVDLMIKKINQPSESISAYKNTSDLLIRKSENSSRQLIQKWKNMISAKDEKTVFNILDRFDINCYQHDQFMPRF